MMITRIRLLAAELSYPEDLHVHTAASGRVGKLSEHYLIIERSDGFCGRGEVRANISYLSKMATEAVAPAILALCERMRWNMPVDVLLGELDDVGSEAPSVARAAIESALVEGIAQATGQPVATFFGGEWQTAVTTNHCLFWGPDEQFDRVAGRYVAEGFRELKVRIAIGSFEEDIARLGRLRERFGSSISIAADANGTWDAEDAVAKLEALAPFDLAYVEQPTEPGDWNAFLFALRRAPMPLMLDEGLVNRDDIERLVAIGAPAMGHLKIVKLGGPRAVVDAARKLAQANVGFMIGQMNEGAMATALATHCVMATCPPHAELYGSYGLLDDVVSGVTYRDGKVSTKPGPGLGVTLDENRCRLVWERRFP